MIYTSGRRWKTKVTTQTKFCCWLFCIVFQNLIFFFMIPSTLTSFSPQDALKHLHSIILSPWYFILETVYFALYNFPFSKHKQHGQRAIVLSYLTKWLASSRDHLSPDCPYHTPVWLGNIFSLDLWSRNLFLCRALMNVFLLENLRSTVILESLDISLSSFLFRVFNLAFPSRPILFSNMWISLIIFIPVHDTWNIIHLLREHQILFLRTKLI